MKKKIFGLEQVLHFRQEMEKLSKMEFSSAKQEFDIADDRLRSEESEMNRLHTEFMAKQTDGISVVELQLYSTFLTKKKDDILNQREIVNTLDQKMSEKRDVMLEAVKDKKILEKLKDKKVTLHRKSLDLKEQAFLDELALRKGGR